MYGISPMDFYEMTCKDIGEFCMSRRKKEEIELKTQASIEYRNVTRILNFFSAKPKKITFEELFPEFDEEQKQREKFSGTIDISLDAIELDGILQEILTIFKDSSVSEGKWTET